jgi:capsular polysaccharide export protein
MSEFKKIILFLQGPHSPFFQRLADELELHGQKCLRINLCFSDRLWWRRSGATNFCGSFEDWPVYLEKFLREHRVTDLVLMGEQRDYHRVAVKMALASGIRVAVTEWGYLRPDWITFEREGMSGNTHFPKNPEEIHALAKQCDDPDFSRRFRDSFARLAIQGFVGDVGDWILGFLHPGYRSHLLANPLHLYLSTALKKIGSRLHREQAEKLIDFLITDSESLPFFVFPLQIEADFQIRAYSKYKNLTEAIEEVVSSFARHAACDHRLVIKLHPMDPGFRPWRKIISRVAKREGIESRVFFLDGGYLEDLVDKSCGVVTINSTSGVTALRSGRPIMVLGESVYRIKGLAFDGALDEFWKRAKPPEPIFCADFIRALAGCLQIKGGFFSKEGMENAAKIAAFRLRHGLVNEPLRERILKNLLSSEDFESISSSNQRENL